jgi:hypothetical protein
MFNTNTRYLLPGGTQRSQSTAERGFLLLLHVDHGDTPPRHTVMLVLPPTNDGTDPEPAIGRPLPDCPELSIARVWRNATSLDARRIARHPNAIARLCPICMESGRSASPTDCLHAL